MDKLTDRRCSRCNAVSGRDSRLRAAFRDSQKCAHLTLENVVLSGFPTTVEPSFPRRVPAGAGARTLPWVRERSVRKGSQEIWPREDIPPPLASHSKFAASAWPGCGFLLPFVRIQGCSMGRLERTLSWWDQEVDRAGRRIRSDVRSAAHEVWEEACRWTRTRLADPAQVADLMEGVVAQVSRYLDRIDAPQSSRKNGLLLLAYSRALRRLAAKSSRLEPVGGRLSYRIVL